jgi:hypothetical protein
MRSNLLPNGVKKFLLDMFPVVLGVLLAFMINNWNESYKNRKKYLLAKAHIVQEIKNNYLECQRVINIQKVSNGFFASAKDSLWVYQQRNIAFSQLPFEGLSIPSISRTAWDAANSSGAIADIGFEELQMLTAIYKMQAVLDEYQNQLIHIAYNNETYSPEYLIPTFHNLQRLNDDYVGIAGSISAAYKVYIEKFTKGSLEE